MQINSLLLSLALPAAAKTVDMAASVAQNLGETFAQALSNSGKTPETHSPEDSHDSFTGELGKLGNRLREFLEEHHVIGSYKVRFQLESSGDQSAAVTGSDAERVRDLLAERPEWLDELRKLAISHQVSKASPMTGRSPLVSIDISDSGTSHWSLL